MRALTRAGLLFVAVVVGCVAAPRVRADVLYVSLFNTNSIWRIDATGNATLFVDGTAGLDGPVGLAFDTGGNLYAANNLGNTITRLTPSGSASLFAAGFRAPYSLAFVPIPEPATLTTTAAAAVTLLVVRSRRRRPVDAAASAPDESPGGWAAPRGRDRVEPTGVSPSQDLHAHHEADRCPASLPSRRGRARPHAP